MQRKVEVENELGKLLFAEDEVFKTITVYRNNEAWFHANADTAVHDVIATLFNEVLAIGADYDEVSLAFKREEQRGANLVRDWSDENDALEDENEKLLSKLLLVDRRATALRQQLARVQAKRAGGLVERIDCPKCGSEYTTSIHARQDGVDGVLVVCIDCDELVPWRALRETEIYKEPPS